MALSTFPRQQMVPSACDLLLLDPHNDRILAVSDRTPLSCQTASDEEIIALLHELALEDLLLSLPEGLATKVGEKGMRLSTGQKQRINIARAILLKRPVLFLDEPTSNLDSTTETAVIRCLSKVSRDTALVIVSHQPAIQEICSRRYRFEAGAMVPGD